jgi:hypothetical protein
MKVSAHVRKLTQSGPSCAAVSGRAVQWLRRKEGDPHGRNPCAFLFCEVVLLHSRCAAKELSAGELALWADRWEKAGRAAAEPPTNMEVERWCRRCGIPFFAYPEHFVRKYCDSFLFFSKHPPRERRG